MKALINLGENTLKIDSYMFLISNLVRNEVNGWRRKNQVERSIPANKPYQPRQFPKGLWRIYGVEYTDNPTFAPVKIKTNAFQVLPIWELDDKLNYKCVTEEMTRDECYWLHYSKPYKTTLGCVRLNSDLDALKIAELIEEELKKVDFIPLEVL